MVQSKDLEPFARRSVVVLSSQGTKYTSSTCLEEEIHKDFNTHSLHSPFTHYHESRPLKPIAVNILTSKHCEFPSTMLHIKT
jgi:hypothetical protein